MTPYSIERCIVEGDSNTKELFKFVEENAANCDLNMIEKGIKERLNKIGLSAMTAYIAVRGTGDVGERIQMEDGTILDKESGLRGRILFTTFGKLIVPRSCYRIEGKPGIMPLDAQINLPDKSYSYLLQEYMDLLAIQNPFGKSSEILDKFVGFKIFPNRIESVSHDSCESFDQFYEAKPLPDPKSEGAINVTGFDGIGVPLIKSESANIVSRIGKGEKRQKKKEAIVGVSYTIDPNVRTSEEVAKNLIYPEKNQNQKNPADKPKAKNIRRIASIERSKDEVFHEVMNDSLNRNPEKDKPFVVVMDGALSLWSILKSYMAVVSFTGILDIIHVTQYLWKVANALFKEGSEIGKKWVYDNLVIILDGRVRDVIAEIERILETKKLKKSQRDAINDCIRYFNNHLDWMKYDEYLKAGYPIGSGVVESTCGHTVKGRMEGTGRRWSVEGAESILLLRSVYTSDDWDEYWLFHMELEKSFHYHQTLAAIGLPDPFNELGMLETDLAISALAA